MYISYIYYQLIYQRRKLKTNFFKFSVLMLPLYVQLYTYPYIHARARNINTQIYIYIVYTYVYIFFTCVCHVCVYMYIYMEINNYSGLNPFWRTVGDSRLKNIKRYKQRFKTLWRSLDRITLNVLLLHRFIRLKSHVLAWTILYNALSIFRNQNCLT